MEGTKNYSLENVHEPIQSEGEYKNVLSEIEKLVFTKGLSSEQLQLLSSLTSLVEDFESKTDHMEIPKPHEILDHLIQSNANSLNDLTALVGTDNLSRILNGEKEIDDSEAEILSNYFNTPPTLFKN